MAGDTSFDADGEAVGAPNPWPRRLARWIGIALLGLVAPVALFLIGLNSDAGRRFVVPQIEKYEFDNGMKIGNGTIDGTLYGNVTVTHFSLADPKGHWITPHTTSE